MSKKKKAPEATPEKYARATKKTSVRHKINKIWNGTGTDEEKTEEVNAVVAESEKDAASGESKGVSIWKKTAIYLVVVVIFCALLQYCLWSAKSNAQIKTPPNKVEQGSFGVNPK